VTLRPAFDSPHVLVLGRELVEQVFRASPDELNAGETKAALAPLFGSRSVILLDGSEHLRKRRLLLPAFHGERIQAYRAVVRDAADRAIDAWPVGRPFALLPSMRSLALDVIARAVFGVEAGARQEELKRRVRAMLDPEATLDQGVTRLRGLALTVSGRFGGADRERLTGLRALAV
jgi:cytochrome P450